MSDENRQMTTRAIATLTIDQVEQIAAASERWQNEQAAHLDSAALASTWTTAAQSSDQSRHATLSRQSGRAQHARRTAQITAIYSACFGRARTPRATRSGAPEEEDHNDDHQHQAEASAIVMVRRTSIESASAEKEYQNNQKDN
jgi:hypothetical protein